MKASGSEVSPLLIEPRQSCYLSKFLVTTPAAASCILISIQQLLEPLLSFLPVSILLRINSSLVRRLLRGRASQVLPSVLTLIVKDVKKIESQKLSLLT